MNLPDIKAKMDKHETRTVAVAGLNYTDSYKEGALESCKNLSARRYPYLSTRWKREQKTAYGSCIAMTSWNELITVRSDGSVYYGTTKCSGGTLSTGTKQMAMINTKLVIFPDKKYLDMTTKTIGNLVASASVTGAVFGTNSNNYSTITVSGDLTGTFGANEAIAISGCTVHTDNNRSISGSGGCATISEISYASGKTTMVFMATTFTEGTETGTITISRPVPDLDYICESENRIWGCNSADQTIYCCALGDPKTWYDYSGESTDSFAVAVGSRGDFTGCCKLSSSVLFFKEGTIHKMLGGYPEEYTLYTYYVNGVKAGCNKSCQVVSETLFYVGTDGVYAYSGGTPSKISSNLGDIDMSDAVAGATSDTYYIAAKVDGTSELYTYNIEKGIWLAEDATAAVDFTTIGNDIYLLDTSGNVWFLTTGEEDTSISWEAVFKPVFETVSGSYNSTTILFAKKRYSKLVLRLDLPEASTIIAEVRMDEGEWQNVVAMGGSKNNIVPFVIPIGRCDQYQLRLRGTGPCTIRNILRSYIAGSDR